MSSTFDKSRHMGKWALSCEMVRLVRRLQAQLEDLQDNGQLPNELQADIDNTVYGFMATLPEKCKDDLLHG